MNACWPCTAGKKMMRRKQTMMDCVASWAGDGDDAGYGVGVVDVGGDESENE